MTRGTPIPETFTIHVPFRLVKRGGRKEMQLPEGAAQPRRTNSALVKALGRAFRWKRLLESGEFSTIAELAEREGYAPVLHDSRAPSHAARAGHRRGDPRRAAGAGDDTDAAAGAVACRLERIRNSVRLRFSLQRLNHLPGSARQYRSKRDFLRHRCFWAVLTKWIPKSADA